MNKQKQYKMCIMELPLKILTLCGCWMPLSWTSFYRRLLYHTYTIFITILINTLMLSVLLDLFLIVDNADDFIDNCYVMLAVMMACFKMCSLLMNYNNIAVLIDILSNNPCSPLEPDEIDIREKFDILIE